MGTRADGIVIVFVGVLSVTVFLGFALANPVTVEAQSANQSSGANNASVVIDANNSTREEVELKTVTLPDNGFIVVQDTDQLMDSDGIVDHTEYVRHGEFPDVVLRFDEPIRKNQTVWVTVHNDTNGNQEFDFEDNKSIDPPYQRNGTVVSDSVQIGANRTQNESQPPTTRSNSTTTETPTPVTESTSTEVISSGTSNLRGSSQSSPQSPSSPTASTRTQSTSPEKSSNSVNNSSAEGKASTGGSTASGVGGGSRSGGNGGPGSKFFFLPVIFLGVVIVGGGGVYLWKRYGSAVPSTVPSEDEVVDDPRRDDESGAITSDPDHGSAQPESADGEKNSIFDRFRGRVAMVFNPHTVDLRAYGLADNDSLVVDFDTGVASVWDQLQRIHELRQLPLELEDGMLQNDQQLPQRGSIWIQLEDIRRVEQRAGDGVALAQETISLLRDVLQSNS